MEKEERKKEEGKEEKGQQEEDNVDNNTKIKIKKLGPTSSLTVSQLHCCFLIENSSFCFTGFIRLKKTKHMQNTKPSPGF